MGKYFDTFPTVVYANTICTDIIRSNKLSDAVKRETSLFYEYTVRDGQRPDMIGFDYYDNPYYDWLVYKSNDIVDPYYDWPMNQNTFDEFVKEKYGSIAKALEKVLYYDVNWITDDSRLTSASYHSLNFLQKQYWRPANDNAVYYVRKELDWKVSTNKTIKVFVDNAGVFNVGDYVNQTTGSVVDASGEVAMVDPAGTYVMLQHIEGNFVASKALYAPLDDVSANTTTTAPILIAQTIPSETAVYWRKVTAYDYELQLNEDKKQIKLVSKDYTQAIQREHEVNISNG